MCVRERAREKGGERERERKREKEKERERERERIRGKSLGFQHGIAPVAGFTLSPLYRPVCVEVERKTSPECI